MSVEGMLLKAYSKFNAMNLPTCRELADKVHTMAVSVDHKIQQWLTPKKVSSIVKGMGFKTKHTNRGATVQIDHATLKSLYKRYGIEAGDEEVMNVGLSSPC